MRGARKGSLERAISDQRDINLFRRLLLLHTTVRSMYGLSASLTSSVSSCSLRAATGCTPPRSASSGGGTASREKSSGPASLRTRLHNKVRELTSGLKTYSVRFVNSRSSTHLLDLCNVRILVSVHAVGACALRAGALLAAGAGLGHLRQQAPLLLQGE